MIKKMGRFLIYLSVVAVGTYFGIYNALTTGNYMWLLLVLPQLALIGTQVYGIWLIQHNWEYYKRSWVKRYFG